jgi:hypothetical protein
MPDPLLAERIKEIRGCFLKADISNLNYCAAEQRAGAA